MLKGLASLALAMLALAAQALAHAPNQAPHQLYKIGDFKLESGEVIKDFSISYVTHGKLNAKKSNAILMVTAISGNHHRLDFMIGPGKALDSDKYFIICTDAIGNGLTTSPSNSTAQPRMQFPKFQIRDMIASQHRLMTEHLGISHVVAVVGPSMGGMQALQWGVSHPGYMDSIVAMVPLAKTPAWSVAVMEASRKAIMLDPEWKGGNYTSPPEGGIRLWRDILGFLAARTPEVYREQFPNSQLDVLPWLQQQEDQSDQGVRRQRLDLPDLGLRPPRRRHHARLQRRYRQGPAGDQGEDAHPARHQGSAEPGVGAAGGRQEYCRRKGGNHPAGLHHRPCRGRRRVPGRRGVPEPRDGRASSIWSRMAARSSTSLHHLDLIEGIEFGARPTGAMINRAGWRSDAAGELHIAAPGANIRRARGKLRWPEPRVPRETAGRWGPG